MDRPTGAPAAIAPPVPPASSGPPAIVEPRQRWRIVFARDAALERTHREIADDWLAGLVAAGLTFPRTEGRPRPPLTFAAPLLAHVAAEREVADLTLGRRLTIAEARNALQAAAPAEVRLVDLHDVWIGEPPLAAAVTAADYRVTIDTTADRQALGNGCQAIVAAGSLIRDRVRGRGTSSYDLRPLLGRLTLEPSQDRLLRMRTLFDPERGAGRPDEVVAALADELRAPIEIRTIVRERLILRDGR